MVWPEPSYRVQLIRDHGLEERDIAGLSGDDAERPVDTVIADSKKAISRTGASLATLFWLFAPLQRCCCRYRDGMPLPNWMGHANRLHRGRTVIRREQTLP